MTNDSEKASNARMIGNNTSRAFSDFRFGRFTAIFFLFSIVAAIVLVVPALRAASLPGDATGAMLVVFPPKVGKGEAFSAIHQAGGMPVRKVTFANIWVVQAPTPGFVENVDKFGAAGVYRNLPIGIALAGCTGVIASLNQ